MKVKNYKQIIQDINNKVYHPIYTLYGEEAYYIDIISTYIENNILTPEEKEFNLTILYGKDTNVLDLISVVKRYPMMSNYQIVILREAQELDKIDALVSYIENPLKSTIFVICYKYKKLDGRTKFAKAVEKHTICFESNKIYENKLPEWINEYVNELKLKINTTASALLAEYAGNNINNLANELDKLALNLKQGDIISEKIIEENIGISREYSVFELQKALGFRHKNKTFKIVSNFASNLKENPLPKVAPMLVDYFVKVMSTRTLMREKASDKDIASLAGIYYSFVKDYKIAASNFSEIQLRKIFKLLREYDLKAKGVDNTDVFANDGELMKELMFKILNV